MHVRPFTSMLLNRLARYRYDRKQRMEKVERLRLHLQAQKNLLVRLQTQCEVVAG